MLWKDITGKVLPSGVVLQELFDIINRDIFETTFLESVKCYPVERKNLKASKAAGLEKIRIHDLRHSHASFLINNVSSK